MIKFVYLSNVCEKLAKGALLYADSSNVLFCEPEFVNPITKDVLREVFFLGAFIVKDKTYTKATSYTEAEGYDTIATCDGVTYYSGEYATDVSCDVHDVATDKEVQDVIDEAFSNGTN